MRRALAWRAACAALLACWAVGADAAPAPSQAEFDRAIAEAKGAMMADPANALVLAGSAERVARRLPAGGALAEATAGWLRGEALARLDRAAEARPVLEQALRTVERVAPRDGLRGNLLLSRGWIEETSGEIAPALRDFQQAYRLLAAAGETRGEARALQNIAGIYQDAGDNARSLRYYSQASEVYRGDPAFSIAAYNNVAETLKQLGRSAEAEAQYRRALALARPLGSPALEAGILTNLAATRLMRGDAAGATALARRALARARNPEAAEERPFAWGVLARIAFQRGDIAEAERLIGRAFDGIDPATSPIPFREFHQLAADIYGRTHQPELALTHLRAFKRLDDSVRSLAASTNAALMAAQFDFSNQNLQIARLQANRARLHELVLTLVVAAVSIVVVILGFAIVSLRRSRNRVRAANAGLSEANFSLEKALKAKSDFLAMTSHEIRTPLNGILGMTQVMLADREVPSPLRTKIQIVHGAGETMRALVDDILDLSKMETGALTIQRGPMRLHRLLSEAASLWRAKAESKGLELRLDLAGAPDAIEEDEDRLRQIVFNLMSNAVKFTETGLVTLAAAAEPDENGGERLAIRVSDTGIGISPEQHEVIFDKFQQADASTSRRYGGTGLGLAICRNLAGALGGEIGLASSPGAGSTFTLSLPLRRVEAPREEAAAGDRTGPSVRMLEPNALTQRIIAKRLKQAADTVAFSATLDDLRRDLAAERPQVAIVHAGAAAHDAAPPLATLLDLIAAAHAGGTRVIILIGEDDGVAPAELAGQADLVLTKPVTPDRLADGVRELCGATPVLASAA